MDKIIITGARSHNLKNISLELPKNRLVVITGLSGSGKSSLAFDTIYAEGQRRYVESLSAYARQFLEQMDKPDVESITGLSPAIAIQQRSPSRNPRSTVGTVTEIYDYLRLLYARVGRAHCVSCGKPLNAWSASAMVSDLLTKYAGKRIRIFAPLVRGRAGTYEELFLRLKKNGFMRARADGKLFELSAPPPLSRYSKHNIDLFVDEMTLSSPERERLGEAVELALKESRGLATVEIAGVKTPVAYSEKNSCPECALSFPELEPRLFSFNSPYGACPGCGGLGVKIEIDPALVVPEPGRSVNGGALEAWANPVTTRTHRWKNSWSGYYAELLSAAAKTAGISLDTPWKELAPKARQALFYGDGAGDFEGVLVNLKRRYDETESEFVKEEIYRRFMRETVCPQCKGLRLKAEGLSVLVGGKKISQLTELPIAAIKRFITALALSEKERAIARLILREINSRLNFLDDVGLGYISLERRSETLSGGEAQRIQLATQIGSGLTGVLYVLDEPTIGLHQRDNARLINTLKTLRDIGNTLIVVEHDEAVIRGADYVVDMGPGAGIHGGQVVASGTPSQIIANPASVTGVFLNGRRSAAMAGGKKLPQSRRLLQFKGASQFNLKNIDVAVPLGLFTCICGVSGSGKSTLLHEIIYKALAKKLYNSKEEPGKFRSMKGAELIDKVVIVDQLPIGRTPRSNPATYSGVFNHIRDIFAEMPEAKRRGYEPGRFSFNVKGGRCEACQGDGTLKIKMQFLPDVYVKCDECGGRRFNEDTLTVRFKGKNISETLAMSVEEASALFSAVPRIARIFFTMNEVGLGYIKLGQSATTLSGGEAQRLKLAEQLSKRATGRTLYILDEPTTGLHFADVEKLLKVLRRLAENGNTVLVIEHNLDVVSSSDWIIELGPEGGDAGGQLVFSGPPSEIIKKSPLSHTGLYLREHTRKKTGAQDKAK
ncbi:MAG: excinuclease ABC subunit A [Elusimicrobia bacterium GWF2_52_66]|nr:MAG: excinuclease ABC subunit A [Elusimicrobia bacterium GWA2_51_34]OGR88203.1 MAG: excinuclease ABC subunit A [Elusimicrobia bacterium GWF2_52_66]HAF95408.1 excinuclease ABC subunit UvrA [Elusimicrobiota bacterium]HCE98728.1 excinuclease ABC subunit UvrA [Elusimicrobiota bacterium]